LLIPPVAPQPVSTIDKPTVAMNVSSLVTAATAIPLSPHERGLVKAIYESARVD
jgi:hypothetical protein